MPFVKKTNVQTSQPPTEGRKIFIGRDKELSFFVRYILQPEDPTHNILSISGNGGVGKSTLLARFIDEAHTPPFNDYCLTALVDERQTGPVSIMEKFAEQLRLAGFPLTKFESELSRYKETFWKLQTERVAIQAALLHEMPGGIGNLTRVFVEELNGLADTQVMLSSDQTTRSRRIILFFDTFEQLAAEAAPWLLDHFLQANISSNIVLVVAGRDPIERSTPDDPKRWLPYRDDGTIYLIDLDSFTEDETRTYLAERDITDPERVTTIWLLSGGLPLYLSLLTFNPQEQVDPTADVVANFLRWIPEQEYLKRRLALDAALFSRPFNQDDLAAFTYLPEAEDERTALDHWLVRLPFVQSNPQNGRYSYHKLVQELFSRHLYRHSQKQYYAARRTLADHYRRLLEKAQGEGGKEVYASGEWLELVLALLYQLFYLPDEASHILAIEQVLNPSEHTERTGEIVQVLRELSQEQPNNLASLSARQTASQLLQYILPDPTGQKQDFLAATSYLLEKVSAEAAFPSKRLAAIYCKRGSTYKGLKEYRRAIEDFDRALELDPNYVAAYEFRSMTYSFLKEYQQAIPDFDRVLELAPENAKAYAHRGIAYRELKDYTQAIKDFERALELEPENAWIYANRGIACQGRKDYTRAIEDFDRALELEPENAWIYTNRGIACREFEDYTQAIKDFDRALELEPENAWIYAQRGKAYTCLEDYLRAIADFDCALVLNPEYTSAYVERGIAYREIKDHKLAIKDFDRALKLDSEYAQAYAERGRSYRRLKEYARAITDYNRARELDPQLVWAYELGWVYVERGIARREREDYWRAIRDFDRALKLGPEDAWTYFERGVTCLWLKDIRQARADFARSWELDSADVCPGWLAEWSLMCQERPDLQAVERLEAIAVVDRDDSIAFVCRGVALGLRGNFVQALAGLEQALLLEPQEWDAYFWKAMVCASLRRDGEARAALEQALNMKLPPVLLTPLLWMEQDRPDFYAQDVLPLLTRLNVF